MTDWTIDDGIDWLEQHRNVFTAAGFAPVIFDEAAATLNLVLVPTTGPIPLRAAVAVFLAEVLPHVSPDRTVAVVPAAEPRLGRYVQIATHDGRQVACFFPLRHYP